MQWLVASVEGKKAPWKRKCFGALGVLPKQLLCHQFSKFKDSPEPCWFWNQSRCWFPFNWLLRGSLPIVHWSHQLKGTSVNTGTSSLMRSQEVKVMMCCFQKKCCPWCWFQRELFASWKPPYCISNTGLITPFIFGREGKGETDDRENPAPLPQVPDLE